jgi:hypothetical protein
MATQRPLLPEFANAFKFSLRGDSRTDLGDADGLRDFFRDARMIAGEHLDVDSQRLEFPDLIRDVRFEGCPAMQEVPRPDH